MYTVIRLIGERILPLNTFDNLPKAIDWTKLQMKYLDREYDYYISEWDLELANKIDVEDRRLKVIK